MVGHWRVGEWSGKSMWGEDAKAKRHKVNVTEADYSRWGCPISWLPVFTNPELKLSFYFPSCFPKLNSKGNPWIEFFSLDVVH